MASKEKDAVISNKKIVDTNKITFKGWKLNFRIWETASREKEEKSAIYGVGPALHLKIQKPNTSLLAAHNSSNLGNNF